MLSSCIPAGAPRLVTVRELSKWFRVCKHTIRRWVRDGKLPRPLPSPGLRQLYDTEQVRAHVAALAAAGEDAPEDRRAGAASGRLVPAGSAP